MPEGFNDFRCSRHFGWLRFPFKLFILVRSLTYFIVLAGADFPSQCWHSFAKIHIDIKLVSNEQSSDAIDGIDGERTRLKALRNAERCGFM